MNIIRRKRSAVYYNVLTATVAAALISYSIFAEGEKFHWHYLLLCFLAVHDYTKALYNWNTPLVILGNDAITCFSFPYKKKILQVENLTVEYLAGDYVFKTDKNYIHRITKSNIPKDQVIFFEEYINNLMNTKVKESNLVTS